MVCSHIGKEIMNETLKIIGTRKSQRAFFPEAVPLADVQLVLEQARFAPSSKNTQPWKVWHLTGEPLEALRNDYLAAFDAKEAPAAQYTYSPNPLPEAWMTRARQVGFALFAHKGIARDDFPARKAHDRENFRFFGAPNLLVLGTELNAANGTFMDCGLFLQNVLNGLASLGYGTCPMYSGVSYPHLLAKHTGGKDTLFVCTVAFGKATAEKVNEFQTEREPLDTWFVHKG
jgi:nitroreductase